MPLAVRERVRRELADGTARHLILSGELARLLKSFEREHIPVIALKGPVLAETLYVHPALRPYTDLDLLIRRETLAGVDDLLQRLGYRRLADAHSFRFDVAYDHATLYVAASGVHVDLHWSLLSEPRYSWNEREAQAVWDRTVPIRVAGEEALGLCPEDLVLYLAVHLAVHHSLAGLLWYYDLFLILVRWSGTLDWPGPAAPRHPPTGSVPPAWRAGGALRRRRRFASRSLRRALPAPGPGHESSGGGATLAPPVMMASRPGDSRPRGCRTSYGQVRSW